VRIQRDVGNTEGRREYRGKAGITRKCRNTKGMQDYRETVKIQR
jgi:hypothetical protein